MFGSESGFFILSLRPADTSFDIATKGDALFVFTGQRTNIVVSAVEKKSDSILRGNLVALHKFI